MSRDRLKKLIYLDHAAATPLDQEVLEAMKPYFAEQYGNASSIHSMGQKAGEAVEQSRKTIAGILNCQPSEIVFTGSGTEADNLAIQGPSLYLKYKDGPCWHIAISAIEHHAVLRPVQYLEQQGFEVTYIPVNEQGIIKLDDLRFAISNNTMLASIMYANNEIGTIQSIAEIGKIIKKVRKDREARGVKTPIYFHTDACQAAGVLDLDVQKLGVDLMTINGSKIYGPKGIGALYVRKGVELEPIIFGGGQERGLRAGTENVAGIAGLAKALEIASVQRTAESVQLIELRDYFIKEILKRFPGAVLNGHPIQRLPNNVNVSVPGVEGETVVLYLSEAGIMASTSSACTAESENPSHVIQAIGRNPKLAQGTIRLSLGRETTREDIDCVLGVLVSVVEKLQLKK